MNFTYLHSDGSMNNYIIVNCTTLDYFFYHFYRKLVYDNERIAPKN